MSDRLLLYLALAGCTLFGVILVTELSAPAPDVGVTATLRHRAAATAAVPHPRPPPRLDKLVATTLARPLFNATRRPAPANADDGANDRDLADMRLTGIVTEPHRRVAIFARAGGKALAVKEGEEVDGWRVEAIAPRKVSLSGPGGTKTLQPKLNAQVNRSVAEPALRRRAAGARRATPDSLRRGQRGARPGRRESRR